VPARSPISPRRQSARLQEKAAKRVGYNNPLTQEICNTKYTKSHIDLLVEEASPMTPHSAGDEKETILDLSLVYTGDETRDGGMTPGPFEEMRRRMAGLGTSTPLTGPAGIRKRKKKEKKRNWSWTINQDGDNDEDVSGAIAAIRAAEAAAAKAAEMRTPIARSQHLANQVPPTPSCESHDSMESLDVEMSDSSSFMSDDNAITPGSMDLDDMNGFGYMKDSLQTPVVVRNNSVSVDPISSEAAAEAAAEADAQGVRRDTPVPPDMLPV
jgi:hypothetical protein